MTHRVLNLTRRGMLSALGVCCPAWSSLTLAQGLVMDFTLPATMRDCWIVNDGVMGGISQSSLRHDPQGMILTVSSLLKIMVVSLPCDLRLGLKRRLRF